MKMKTLTNDEKKNKYYLTKYGITYEEFKEKAKDGCECCGIKEGRLCQDHIHVAKFKELSSEDKKLYLRGVSCFICNTAYRVLERTKDGRRNRLLLENLNKYFSKYRLKGES